MAGMRFEFEDQTYEIEGELTTREWKLLYRHCQLSPPEIEEMDPMAWPPGVWTGFLHVAIKRSKPNERDEEIIKHLDDQPLETIITSFKAEEDDAAGQSPPATKSEESPAPSGEASRTGGEPSQAEPTPESSGSPPLEPWPSDQSTSETLRQVS